MPRHRFAISLLAVASSLPGIARAEKAETKPGQPAWERARRERRSGFTTGLSFGGGLAQAAGYPNDAKKIGRERYYTQTSVGPAAAGTLWIGGALADWLTFGLGFAG